MGVQGLLPLLKSIHKQTTLKTYTGQTLGVDAFGWLHRGAVACSLQLALDRPTTQYVSFVINRVKMLLDFGIIPYLVFDGDALPSKSGTNMKRRKEREAAKELGMSLYRSGKKDQAFQEFQKAVSVTPQMTFALIEELRQMSVHILVAPYEADAQLTYLEKQGIIDGVLSEDSDLLVFGVKKLITKLDQHGSCIEINRADFPLNKDISFAGWSDTMFRRMAILSGCDYLASVNGIGLRKAHEFVKKYKEIEKITRVMSFQGKHIVSTDYAAKFRDAECAFLYHRVFCPKAGRMVFLNTVPPDIKVEEMFFLGKYVEPEVALGVARGDLNPKTKEPFAATTKATAKRPLLQENRRQTIGGSTELKSIGLEDFFKPYRRPLAELDPNSLTPSPLQQRVLERSRNASWEPQIVYSEPPLRRAFSDIRPPSSTSQPVESRRISFLAKAAALSKYEPVKRQRLCSESDEKSPLKEVKQSKFFSAGTVEQSPLKAKSTRDRRSNKAAFDLFSDDTVESPLLDFEQVTQVKTQTVEYPELPALVADERMYEEVDIVPQSSPIKTQAALVDSQSSHGTVELDGMALESQREAEGVATVKISQEKDPDTFVDLLDYHVKKLNEAKKDQASWTFSNQSIEEQSLALSSLQPCNQSDEEEHEAEPGVEDTRSPERTSSTKFHKLAKTFAFQSSTMQTRALQSLGKSPAIPHITNSATRETLAGGSEDQILRSSQDEGSDAEVRSPPPVRKLDLTKFRYLASPVR